MKILTLEILNGFTRMRAKLGSDTEIAKQLNLSKAHIGRIRKNQINYINDDTWDRIKPILAQYMSKEELETKPSNAELYTSAKQILRFPIISSAAAAECNTAFYPLLDYAEENSEGMVSFTEGRKGDVVIRVTGSSMEPWYPEGTLILVRPNQRVRTGERVVAVLNDGEIVFKCFAEKGDKFCLFSINENGKDFIFEKKNFTAVRGIYVVIQSMRDERALDRAMSQVGIHHAWERKLEEVK